MARNRCSKPCPGRANPMKKRSRGAFGRSSGSRPAARSTTSTPTRAQEAQKDLFLDDKFDTFLMCFWMVGISTTKTWFFTDRTHSAAIWWVAVIQEGFWWSRDQPKQAKSGPREAGKRRANKNIQITIKNGRKRKRSTTQTSQKYRTYRTDLHIARERKQTPNRIQVENRRPKSMVFRGLGATLGHQKGEEKGDFSESEKREESMVGLTFSRHWGSQEGDKMGYKMTLILS